MPNPTVRGHFVWHELTTTDTKSAAAFFATITGWKTQTWDQNPSYSTFMTGGRPMAGLMVLPDEVKQMGAPPHWLTYIGTPNVDETATQAATLGGKVLKQPADIPTIGRFAVIQDPQGAVFAAFTPLQFSAPTVPPGVGDFSWHELATTDWHAALPFYQRLFGWETTSAMDMGPEMGTYQMFGWKDLPLGGMFNKPPQQPGPAAWLPYIKVKDSKKAAAIIKKSAKLVNGPMQVPGGDWIAQGIDPQGAFFAVHSAKPAAATKPAKPAAAKRPTKAKSAKGTAKPVRAAAAAGKRVQARKSAGKGGPKGQKKGKKTGAKRPAKKAGRPKGRR